jgi:hypothetical protein
LSEEAFSQFSPETRGAMEGIFRICRVTPDITCFPCTIYMRGTLAGGCVQGREVSSSKPPRCRIAASVGRKGANGDGARGSSAMGERPATGRIAVSISHAVHQTRISWFNLPLHTVGS